MLYIVLHSHFAYFECKSLENALLMTQVNIQLSFIWLDTLYQLKLLLCIDFVHVISIFRKKYPSKK